MRNMFPRPVNKNRKKYGTMEASVKQAIDEDDAQELYEVLQQHAAGGIDSIVDRVYDGFKGNSCLHRYRRHKPSCVS